MNITEKSKYNFINVYKAQHEGKGEKINPGLTPSGEARKVSVPPGLESYLYRRASTCCILIATSANQ